MLGYVMVGTNDLKKATQFYDLLMKPLGLVRDVTEEDHVGYSAMDKPENPEFYVTLPYNRLDATPGNGTMIALQVSSLELVEEFHRAGLEAGGQDEGKPDFRPEGANVYYAYIRDFDGNKICAFAEN